MNEIIFPAHPVFFYQNSFLINGSPGGIVGRGRVVPGAKSSLVVFLSLGVNISKCYNQNWKMLRFLESSR